MRKTYKMVLIFLSSILIIGVLGLSFLAGYNSTANKASIDESKSTNVSIKDLYNYMINQESDFDATYKYIESTDSIQVMLNNIQSESLKNLFISKDEETNIVYLKDNNETMYLVNDNSIFYTPISEDKDISYVYFKLSSAINEYKDSIPEDIGDAKDYGEDVSITENPDGSLSIKKD